MVPKPRQICDMAKGAELLVVALWFSGCGKTVLNAKVVRYLRDRSSGSGPTIHFYFDFRSRQNSVEFMLRSLLLQLLDRSSEASGEIERLFRACRSSRREPTRRELLETLRNALAVEGNVYLLFDALDECDRKGIRDLMAALERMHNWDIPNAHFLITSRRDGNVLSVLEDIVPVQYRMEVPQHEVDQDIETWLEQQLSRRGRSGRKLSGWGRSEALREEIRSGLLGKVCGLYDTLILCLPWTAKLNVLPGFFFFFDQAPSPGA